MNKINSFVFPSEFSKDGYNQSFIEKCIESAMSIPDNEVSVPIITEHFNCFLMKYRMGTVSWNRNEFLKSELYTDMLTNLDIPVLDMVDDSSAEVKEYSVDLMKELSKLRLILDETSEKCLYDIETSKKFLEEFLRLSAKAVFNPDNNNLNNLVFRKSKTLENLYSIGRIPFIRAKSGNGDDEGYSYFNICNPFALDSLRRVIINSATERNRFSRVATLRLLRINILKNQALRAFTRFTSYRDFSSYKVELNRHNSEIISVPYHKLSSIEAVKPLRLFEKTVTYIHKRLADSKERLFDKELEIKILLIGHTEESIDNQNNFDDREIFDWIYSVLAWYDRSFDNKSYPILNICITNLINDGDFCASLEQKKHERKNIFGNYRSQKYNVKIETVDYQSDFYFSTIKLKEYCNNNDLIFIIDCPWLTVESYDLKKDVSLGIYSRNINRLDTILSDDDCLDSNNQTIIQELDTQYNRITSSDSNMHGDISRVFREKVLNDIRSFIIDGRAEYRQELYVFTSERDGVDYSYLGSYPLTRTELYGGKCFTISMFSNVVPSCLQVSKNPKPFVIKLWSILKYISISFACTIFKESIDEIIHGYIQTPEQYFELMRDIFVIIELGKTLNELNVSVRFSERIAILFKEMGIDKEESNIIMKRLYDLTYEFIYSLYTEAVFSEHNDFGDNYIKKGFEMNLTSNARDVSAMLFVHEYRKAVNNHQTDRYTLCWNEKFDTMYYEDKNYIHEFFMDKELYSILLNNLEYNDYLSIGTMAMLNKSNSIYNMPAMAHHLLNNIIGTYEALKIDNNSDNIKVVQNAKHAIEQLK